MRKRRAGESAPFSPRWRAPPSNWSRSRTLEKAANALPHSVSRKTLRSALRREFRRRWTTMASSEGRLLLLDTNALLALAWPNHQFHSVVVRRLGRSRRDDQGPFKESVDVSRSLSQDVRRKPSRFRSRGRATAAIERRSALAGLRQGRRTDRADGRFDTRLHLLISDSLPRTEEGDEIEAARGGDLVEQKKNHFAVTIFKVGEVVRRSCRQTIIESAQQLLGHYFDFDGPTVFGEYEHRQSIAVLDPQILVFDHPVDAPQHLIDRHVAIKAVGRATIESVIEH